MTATTALSAQAARAAGNTPLLPVAREIALVEARRLLTHPLVLLGAALYCAVLVVSSSEGAGSGYGGLVTGQTFFVGVFTYFAANLVATRPQRHHCLEQHDSLPAPAVARTAGVCLAALAPALLSTALVLATMAWFASGRVDLPQWPSLGELAAPPLTVLGAALLGTMVGRWLPFPMAPALVMIGVVALTLFLSEGADDRYGMLSPFVSFSIYSPDGSWVGRIAGSPGWHAVYLAALCGMAAAGALLRDARRWIVPLIAGAALTGVAVVAGLVQLP